MTKTATTIATQSKPSAPIATGTKPAATATAEPLDEPPG